MPYITRSERDEYDDALSQLNPATEGRLNYCLTQICNNYIKLFGLSYTTISRIVGALECVKQEFYRRIAVPYEDSKITQNGDVYK